MAVDYKTRLAACVCVCVCVYRDGLLVIKHYEIEIQVILKPVDSTHTHLKLLT